MKYTVTCTKDNIQVEVTERAQGEQCSVIRQVISGDIVDDEKTGPEYDEVSEFTN